MVSELQVPSIAQAILPGKIAVCKEKRVLLHKEVEKLKPNKAQL